MQAIGRTIAAVGGVALAGAGALYAFGGESPLDTSTPVRRVAGFATTAAGLAVASAALPGPFRRGPFAAVADTHAGRMLVVGAGALLAGIGMSHAFANDFPPGDMTTEGHFETGLAAMALGAGVGGTAITSATHAGRVARGVIGLGGVALTGWFAGSAIGDYASGSQRGAPATNAPHF